MSEKHFKCEACQWQGLESQLQYDSVETCMGTDTIELCPGCGSFEVHSV